MSDFSSKNSFSASFGTFYNLGGDFKIIRKENRNCFPDVGNEKFLYVADDTETIYFWNDIEKNYVTAKSESTMVFPDVLRINGGNAGSIYEEK